MPLFLCWLVGAGGTLSGCPDTYPDSEGDRVQVYKHIVGAWPPTRFGKNAVINGGEWGEHMHNKVRQRSFFTVVEMCILPHYFAATH